MSKQLFVSNRDVVVRSKNTGHAIAFEKGVPMQIPPAMVGEVLEKGILPVDAQGKAVDPGENEVVVETSKVVLAPEDGFERSQKILEVIKAIVARNDAKDFAGPTPSAIAVTAALGWKVDQKEVRQVWEKNRQALLNKEKAE